MRAWGAGLFVEPALKVTFADGNRDLVLHYEQQGDSGRRSNCSEGHSRDVFVTLHYSIDPETGILARSATIENREKQPITMEQAAAARGRCLRRITR